MKLRHLVLIASVILLGISTFWYGSVSATKSVEKECQTQIDYYLDNLRLQEEELEEVYNNMYKLRDSISKIEPQIKYYPKYISKPVDTSQVRVYARVFGEGNIVVLDTLVIRGHVIGSTHKIYDTSPKCIDLHPINCVESVGVNETLVSVPKPETKTLGFFEKLWIKLF